MKHPLQHHSVHARVAKEYICLANQQTPLSPANEPMPNTNLVFLHPLAHPFAVESARCPDTSPPVSVPPSFGAFHFLYKFCVDWRICVLLIRTMYSSKPNAFCHIWSGGHSCVSPSVVVKGQCRLCHHQVGRTYAHPPPFLVLVLGTIQVLSSHARMQTAAGEYLHTACHMKQQGAGHSLPKTQPAQQLVQHGQNSHAKPQDLLKAPALQVDGVCVCVCVYVCVVCVCLCV